MQKFPHTFDGFRRKSCIWQFTGNNIGVQLHKWCTTPFSKPGKGPFWRKRDTKESKGCPTFTFWCHLQDADISEPSFDVLIPAGANIFDVLYLLWLWLVSKSRWQIENLVVMVNQLVLIHLRQHCLHHRPCQSGNWLEGFYHHIPHHAPYFHNPTSIIQGKLCEHPDLFGRLRHHLRAAGLPHVCPSSTQPILWGD